MFYFESLLVIKASKLLVCEIIIIIIIIIQHLYSAMKSGDTEALGGARLRRVEQMSL